MKIDIMKLPVDNVTLSEAVNLVMSFTEKRETKTVATPNGEIAALCLKNADILNAVSSADLVIPDGAGIVLASKILGTPLKEKVAGVDLAAALLPKLTEQGKSVFLLGGKKGVAQKAAEKIKEHYPELKIAGFHNGYFLDEDEIVDLLNKADADVIYVCLGAPKQEFFMERNKGKIKTGVMLGLGGTIDVFAGKGKRAPSLLVEYNLEWLYRLIKEPKRFNRVIKLPGYVCSAYIYRMKKGKRG